MFSTASSSPSVGLRGLLDSKFMKHTSTGRLGLRAAITVNFGQPTNALPK
jgi:hypothetical protein